MTTSPGTWQALVAALTPPLKFAARNDFANVARLVGLEGLARASLDRASEVDEASKADLRALLHGFDSAGLPARARTVRALLEVLARPAVQVALTDPLGLALTAVQGLPAKRAAELARRGLHTVGDVLFTLPRTWEDRRATRRIIDLQPGAVAVVSGTVAAAGASGFGGGRRYEVVLDDSSGTLRLVFFHYRAPEMHKRFAMGTVVTVAGEVQTGRGARVQMVHPRAQAGARMAAMGGVHPVYPEIGGLHPLELGRAVQTCLDAAARAGGVLDPLPPLVRAAGKVMDLGEALRALHTAREDVDPETLRALIEHRSPAHRRLAFQELFVLGTALALRRRSALVERAPALVPAPMPTAEAAATLEGALPFTPTQAQRRAIEEILRDVARPSPMARLLQGDVGSGKTAVAAALCLRAVRAGHQAAFMAPTELLAEQHGRTLKALLAPIGVRVEVITGGLTKKARAIAEARLKNRDLDVAVGTQALLSQNVSFARLGVCIADEQHRFGVVQRAALRKKGPVVHGQQLMPHLLVMTATPIPRSLALTVYGDLSVSVLDELPPGRSPVATHATHDFREAHRAIKAVLARGERAFVVYPLIDAQADDQKAAAGDLAAATTGHQDLRELFGEVTALLHGKLPVKERDATMARFQSGAVQVLVATTVVEVGVDVPEATLMVIMNAERFGLAQLHQLRGRVGRSTRKSECLLVVGGGSDEAMRRIAVMQETNDGFRIAEEDLRLRGAGDVLGTRQSGLPSLAFADFVRHAPLIELSRALADELVDGDPSLAHPDHAGLRVLVHERYAARLALASAG